MFPSVYWRFFSNEPPPLVIIGHSLGGAIAIRLVASRTLPSITALCVLDVVEGTALASLAHMRSVLENRPSQFESVEKSIVWSIRSNTVRNSESARVSVPPLLRLKENGKWGWRTDLQATEPFWEGWFTGLSQLFLTCPASKLLMLVGTDRLDKDLTVAHMQGKFQVQLIPQCGHLMQEDAPDLVAARIVEFASRQRIPGLQVAPR
eukprot:gnl/Hemi2/7877_TR2723_c0_g1_i1.p2 gnl/Hemi2/7877_TR2723_c0_g1~~gnl/Hemi2/7877_TR2723_c0_g1_i1.p2  ORF type:complete len:206 (-),score=17.45 gnl/Hemi2/7877_TR2723_c0_g1_i1:158-775(-)